MIFGKTTPARLREVTGQSKATMFRNLARLFDAGIIQKEEIELVEDKRYSTHYYISENLMDLTKGLYSMEMRKYAEAIGRSDLIKEWLSLIEVLPYLLHQKTSQAILLAAQTSAGEDGSCNVVSKYLSFRVTDIDDVGSLHKKLNSIVEYIDQKETDTKRDFKQPLVHPVAISVSVVSLNPKGLPKDSGMMVEVREC